MVTFLYLYLAPNPVFIFGFKILLHKALRLFSTHRKIQLAGRTFIQSLYLKALIASLRVGFCVEWERDLKGSTVYSRWVHNLISNSLVMLGNFTIVYFKKIHHARLAL